MKRLKILNVYVGASFINLINLNTSPKYNKQSEADNIDSFFKIEELHKLQDLFSEVHQVASIIVDPDGTPITKPSNFCGFCNDIIRKTEKGASLVLRF